MGNKLNDALAIFDENVASVRQLMNFDRDVLELAISETRSLRDRLKQAGLDNPSFTTGKTLQALEQIRKNDSLRSRYESIFNQALVLLVAYFGSTVSEMFKLSLMEVIESQKEPKVLKEDLRLTVREIRDLDFDLEDSLSDLFIEKHDISFQDMQSIGRAFRNYIEIEAPAQDRTVNNIIAGQAARNIIAHAGGVVNDRTLRQVANANPRDVKPDLVFGQRVLFTPDEVEVVATNMRAYVRDLAGRLSKKLDFTYE